MTSLGPQSSIRPPATESTVPSRIELLRAEAQREADPARKARLHHAAGRLLDVYEKNDVAAANEYLAAFQASRAHREALADLIGIYERRRSASNLVKLYQVDAKSAPTAERRASALLDLHAARLDLAGDAAGASAALKDAFATDPASADIALAVECAARAAADRGELIQALRARITGADDPGLGAELRIDLAEELAADGKSEEALRILGEGTMRGAPGVRLCLARERIARRAKDGPSRARALEQLAELAATACTSPVEFEESGIGALLWADADGARAWAVSAYRAAANLACATEEGLPRAGELYTKALTIEPSAPSIRLERLALAARLGRDDWAAEDEEALADVLGDGAVGAFVYSRLAARLDRLGRADDAAEARAMARALAPESPVLAAAAESGLRDRAHAAEWLRSLGVDSPTAPAAALLEAAYVASELLGDDARARDYFERAIELGPDASALLAHYGGALVAGNAEVALSALARLEGLGLDPASSRSRAVHRAVLSATALPDPTPSTHAARALLALPHDPSADDQARADEAQIARVIGALADDYELLELAHRRLAESGAAATRAVHLAAAARAATSRGALDVAISLLEAACAASPHHPALEAWLRELYVRAGRTDDVQRLDAAIATARAGESSEVVAALAELASRLVGRDAEEGTVALARSLLTRFPGSRSVRDAVATVVASARSEALDVEWCAAAIAHGTGEERASAAQRTAVRALRGGDPARASQALALALEAPALARQAACLAALLPAPARAGLPSGAVVEALNAAGIDAELALSDDLGARNDPTEDPLAQRAGDASPATATTASIEALGGAATVSAQVHRSLGLTGEDLLGELALLALRAIATEGAGELAAALADAAIGPAGDANIRAAALESAVRGARPDELAAYESRLGRVRLELNRPRDAVALLDRAVAARPDDLAALEALRFAARDAGEPARFVAAADALAAKATGQTAAELLEDAAAVLVESLRDKPGALARARRALELAPNRDRAYQRVHGLLRELGDTAGLAQLAARRAARSESSEARVKQLFEAARHLRTGNDRDGAIRAIDELLSIDPLHAGALAMKAEIHVQTESFAEAVDALRALARADVPATQKKVALLGAADFLERKLGRSDAALVELRAADALGLADAAMLQRMARLAEHEDYFDEAIGYHARVTGSEAIPLRIAESHRNLGRLQQRVKRDPVAAAEQYRKVLAIVPDDVDVAVALLSLVQGEDERTSIARAVDAAVRSKLTPATLDATILRKMLRIADLRGARDLMKLVLSTLTTLRVATDEERSREEENTAFVRRVRPPAHPIHDSIERMRAEGDSGPYAELAMQLFDLLTELDAVDLGKLGANKNDPSAKTDPVRTELTDLGAAFGIGEVETYPSGQIDARKVVGVPTERGLALVVPRGLAVPIDPSLRFHAGRITYAAAHRTLPLIQRPPEEAAVILLGALDAAEVPIGDLKSRPGVADWSKAIGRVLGRRQRKAIHDLGATLDDRGRRAEAYCRAARQSSLRAGLLVSSDLETALGLVLGATPTLDRCLASPEAADLVCFHLSATSLALRRDLGLAS